MRETPQEKYRKRSKNIQINRVNSAQKHIDPQEISLKPRECIKMLKPWLFSVK